VTSSGDILSELHGHKHLDTNFVPQHLKLLNNFCMYHLLMSFGVLLLDTSGTKMEAGSHPAMKEIQMILVRTP
jgi:hypothetical protein